jgi:hypothetical protein
MARQVEIVIEPVTKTRIERVPERSGAATGRSEMLRRIA